MDANLPDGTTPAVVLPSRARRSRRPHRHRERTYSPHSTLGPKKSGLVELKPSDPRFKSVVSYQRYRLHNPDAYRGRSISDKIGTFSRIMHPFTKDSKFSVWEDPKTILAFLTKLKAQLDNNRISEKAALSIIPDYLEDRARDDFLRHCDLETMSQVVSIHILEPVSLATLRKGCVLGRGPRGTRGH